MNERERFLETNEKSEQERFLEELSDPKNAEGIKNIVAAALRLERSLYTSWRTGEDSGPFLFWLRKSLEGVWGDDLPELDEFGNCTLEQGGER